MSYDPLVTPTVTPDLAMPATYWHDTTALPDYQTLKENIDTDVAVIGGGYTGLNAADYLAQQNVKVTLIDAHAPGFGCAGRNGGFVLSGSGRLGVLQLADKFGHDVANALGLEFDAAVEWIKSRVATDAIDCDLTTGPYYKIAYSQKHRDKLIANARRLEKEFGQASQFIDTAELTQTLPAQRAFGAIVQPGLALNPLKLALGFTRAARQKGAQLFHQSPVISVSRNSNGFELVTPQGNITANKVLIATNAYTPRRFHSSVDGRQFPVQSSVLVTNPLSPAQAEACGMTNPLTAMDTRMMKYYYRVLPDGRVLFGGRGEVAGKGHDSLPARQRLYKALLSSFPALAGIGISHFWSGWVSVALDDLPRIHVDHQHGIGYAMGYCGSGVSFASLAGKRLAQQLLGEELDMTLPIYNSELPPFPLPAFRRLALRTLYAWAAMTKQ